QGFLFRLDLVALSELVRTAEEPSNAQATGAGDRFMGGPIGHLLSELFSALQVGLHRFVRRRPRASENPRLVAVLAECGTAVRCPYCGVRRSGREDQDNVGPSAGAAWP